MSESNVRGLVIVPTYNECETVAHVIERLFAASGDIHLLVVDDHSPDGTSDIVRATVADHPGAIHLLERRDKRGLGSAYVDGFRWAIEHGYPAVVEMDADGSHDPAVVPALLDALEKADLSIGSRYVGGGGVRNWSRGRQMLSAAGNWYAPRRPRVPRSRLDQRVPRLPLRDDRSSPRGNDPQRGLRVPGGDDASRP